MSKIQFVTGRTACWLPDEQNHVSCRKFDAFVGGRLNLIKYVRHP